MVAHKIVDVDMNGSLAESLELAATHALEVYGHTSAEEVKFVVTRKYKHGRGITFSCSVQIDDEEVAIFTDQ